MSSKTEPDVHLVHVLMYRLPKHFFSDAAQSSDNVFTGVVPHVAELYDVNSQSETLLLQYFIFNELVQVPKYVVSVNV